MKFMFIWIQYGLSSIKYLMIMTPAFSLLCSLESPIFSLRNNWVQWYWYIENWNCLKSSWQATSHSRILFICSNYFGTKSELTKKRAENPKEKEGDRSEQARNEIWKCEYSSVLYTCDVQTLAKYFYCRSYMHSIHFFLLLLNRVRNIYSKLMKQHMYV